MGYLSRMNSLHRILRVPGFDQKQMAHFIYRGLIAGRKTEEMIHLVLSRPAGFKPFLPQDRVDPLFDAILANYASGIFAKDGIKTMRLWVELVNNYSAPGLISRGMLLKTRKVADNLKLPGWMFFDRESQNFRNKVDLAKKAIFGWQKSAGSLIIIENYLYYHAEEISKELGLPAPRQK